MAIALVAVLGMAALGVDVGLLSTTAGEIQNAADLTALAGVRALGDGDSPEGAAKSLLQRNQAHGTVLNASNLSSLTIGNFTDEAGFVSNLPPLDAVESVVVFQHKGILSNVVGMPISAVTKKAVATLMGVGTLRPTLPVVVGDCHFDPDCEDDICMPFIQLHGSQHDNAAWTGFFDGHSASTIKDFIPTPCGGGRQAPELKANDPDMIDAAEAQYVDIIEGGATSVLQAVACMFNNIPQMEHIIPIVRCDPSTHFNKPAAVVGFATVVIESVNTTGSAEDKGISLRSIHRITLGPSGGGKFGTRVAKLVK